MHWADAWLKEAMASGVQRNPNSMTIVSVDDEGQPSARVVLCKQFIPDPGYLVFHTNYRSRKSRELSNNPRAAAVFHWDSLGRQVRIEGLVVQSPEKESDDYFASRGWGSQLGAWGSDQSEPVESKAVLIKQIRARGESLGLSLGADTTELVDDKVPTIERPPHWACGPMPSSSGSKVRTAFTIAAAGRATSSALQTTIFRSRRGEARVSSPEYMPNQIIEKDIGCPFCGETISVLLDLSAGDQSYIEDCQVCCRPMEISFAVGDLEDPDVRVDCAS